MSKIIYVGGTKGGTGKTTTAHALCLGAILRRQPSTYVLTDPHRKVRGEGRPYSCLDGREAKALAAYITNSESLLNGWCFIDGGGNRPAFDKEMASIADLTLLPFKNSQEDVDAVRADLKELPKAIAWPTAWPSNKLAATKAHKFIAELEKDFPGRVLHTPVLFVNSSNELLDTTLDDPSTPLRSLAKRAFGVLEENFAALTAAHEQAPKRARGGKR